MAWIREGDCPPERCKGRCCEHFGIWFNQDEDSRRFLQMLQFRGTRVLEGKGQYLLDVQSSCQYLEKGLCRLHPDMAPGPDLPPRPQFCEEWPVQPDQLVADPYCGFTFRWEDD